MADVVAAPPRGLELFAPKRRALSLKLPTRRAKALQKLGIETVQDVLQHYPRYHVDRTQVRTVRELGKLAADGYAGEVQVHARVVNIGRPFRIRNSKRTMLKGRIGDESGTIAVTWFNQDWVARALTPGNIAFFYGRLTVFRGTLQMTAPRFELLRTGKEPFNVGRIIPIYRATADFSSDQIRRVIWETLAGAGNILDPLPEDMRLRLGLMTRTEAVRLIGF